MNSKNFAGKPTTNTKFSKEGMKNFFPTAPKKVFCRKQDIDQIVQEHKGFELIGKKSEGQGCVTLRFQRV